MKSFLRYEALEIFKTFDNKEFSDFQHFLNCGPYLNNIGGKFSFGQSIQRKKQSVKLVKFFTLLKPFYPEFKDLSNAYLMKKMDARSISSIKKYFMNLKIMCEHFMVLREIAIDKYYYDEALLYQYQGRFLKKLFDTKYKKVIQELDEPQFFNVKDFLMKFDSGLTNFTRHAADFVVKSRKDIPKVIDMQVDPSFNLLFYFVFDSIKVSVNLIAHANANAIDLKKIEFYTLFKKSFPDETLQYIIKKAIHLNTNKTTKKIIELYWLNYLFRTTNGKDAGQYFKKYIDILEAVGDKLSANEKFDFFTEKNFGIWLAMKYPEFEDEEFRMYDLYLKHKAYKASGKENIQLLELKNLIIRGDNTGRFVWTSNVMKNYLHELAPEYQDMLAYLRNALLYFYRDKNFDKALEFLREVEKKGHHTMTKDVLHLYILIFYELGYYDSALSYLDSLRKYISNQNIGPATALPFKKFITCTRTLITNVINNTDNFESIVPIISGDDIVASKLWLCEKVTEQKSKFLKAHKKFQPTIESPYK